MIKHQQKNSFQQIFITIRDEHMLKQVRLVFYNEYK